MNIVFIRFSFSQFCEKNDERSRGRTNNLSILTENEKITVSFRIVTRSRLASDKESHEEQNRDFFEEKKRSFA